MEVEADYHTADGKAREQDARDEFLRGKTGKCSVEAQHDRAVEPCSGEKPQFRPLLRKPEQCLVRAKNAPRLGLDGEHCRGYAEHLRTLERGGDHRAVAAMHAVEIADRDDSAAQRLVRSPFASDDDE